MSKNIHIKKFDGGRRTPQEYHRQYAFPPDAKCSGCQAKPAVRAIVMAPLDEAAKRGIIPEAAKTYAGALMFPHLQPVLVQLTNGWHVRISKAYSCSMCRKTFEQQLAKGPSWCVVDISAGPDPKNRVVVGVT